MLLPQTSLDRVLGDRTAKSFAKNLGLKTIADLLLHFPRRYASRGELTKISELPVGEAVSVVAEILDVRERRMTGRKGSILEVRITDGNGTMSLTFFNQAWRQKDLVPGSRGLFAGKTGIYQGKIQLAHPDYELFPEDISGEAAKQVGVLMEELAHAHQLIAITHQPQIAARANQHLYVYKQEANGSITTNIRVLGEQERIQTIASMLAGENPSEAVLASAREMMK